MNRIINCCTLFLILLFILSCSKDPDPTPPEASIHLSQLLEVNCISDNSVNENEFSVNFSWNNNSKVSYFTEILNLNNTKTVAIISNDSKTIYNYQKSC